MIQLLADAAACDASTSWPEALVMIALIVGGAAVLIALSRS